MRDDARRRADNMSAFTLIVSVRGVMMGATRRAFTPRHDGAPPRPATRCLHEERFTAALRRLMPRCFAPYAADARLMMDDEMRLRYTRCQAAMYA